MTNASKVAWTPGKWKLETHQRYGHDRMVPVWYIKAENDVGIAVQPSFSSPQHEQANARLIASAPELYEALSDWLSYAEENLSQFDDAGECDDLCPRCRSAGCIGLKIRNARAALAKARGEQP